MTPDNKVQIDCNCDSCKLGKLFIEFKRKGADPVVILEMVGDVLGVLYGVELVTREMLMPDTEETLH